jgi:hypothetical protein
MVNDEAAGAESPKTCASLWINPPLLLSSPPEHPKSNAAVIPAEKIDAVYTLDKCPPERSTCQTGCGDACTALEKFLCSLTVYDIEVDSAPPHLGEAFGLTMYDTAYLKLLSTAHAPQSPVAVPSRRSLVRLQAGWAG